MAKLGDMFPSNYLKADDCDEADLVLTIDDVRMETIGQGKDADSKPVVYFRETRKGLVLNKTNGKTISKLHGDDTDDWEGKRVALFATEVEFQGDQVMAIRVRLKAPKGKAVGPVPAAPQHAPAPSLATTPRPPGPGPEYNRPVEGDDIDNEDVPF